MLPINNVRYGGGVMKRGKRKSAITSRRKSAVPCETSFVPAEAFNFDFSHMKVLSLLRFFDV
jgi:hypothetical protein